MMSEGLKIVTNDDLDLAKKPAARQPEPEILSDADSSQLVELLDDIDGLKYEIHERMRRIEAVKQAKSLLLEDAIKTEALNKRLAAIGKAMTLAPVGMHAVEPAAEEPKLLRLQPRETPKAFAPRVPEPARIAEPVRFATEEQEAYLHESHDAFAAAERRLQEPRPLNSIHSMPASEESASGPAYSGTRYAENGHSRNGHSAVSGAAVAPGAFAPAYPEPNYSEHSYPELVRSEQVHSPPVKTAPEYADNRVRPAEHEYRPLASGGPMAPAFDAGETKSHFDGDFRLQADVATLEPHEPMAQALNDLPVQDYRGEEGVLGEGFWGSSHQIPGTPVAFGAAAQIATEASGAYNAATARLEQAEEAWRRSEQAAHEAKRLLDQSLIQLNMAHSKEEKASADLHSAQQEMTTAYQFAAVAAQRQHDAAQYFRRATRWTTVAAALSWVGMSWVAWIALPQKFPWLTLPIWAPGIATGVILLIALLVSNWGVREQAE